MWDHPRACGEHELLYENYDVTLGSSPRLRGTLTPILFNLGVVGIIPALAGNTMSNNVTIERRWDHPRACGEHIRLDDPREHIEGSSPRLRGTLIAVYCSGLTVGIIPALAGNTVSHLWSPPFRWDHPRACGEHGG